MEGRALLAASPLDPSFNSGQPILTPADGQSTTGLDAIAAVAVQPNGQIVVVGQTNAISQAGDIGLAVQRYNSDGSLDTTFGTGGETDIPLASSENRVVPAGRVLIQPDGMIVLGADLELVQSSLTPSTQPVIIRLTAAGALDSTVGTNGEAFITLGRSTNSATRISDLALTPEGKIVVGGTYSQITFGTSIYAITSYPAIARLLGNGAVDSSFHGGNLVTLDPATYSGPNAYQNAFEGVAVTSTGQVLVSYQVDYGNQFDSSGEFLGRIYEPRIAEFSPGGSIYNGFGVQGIVQAALPSTTSQSGAFALQPDDAILLIVGPPSGDTHLLRFTASGQPDATFATPALSFAPNSIAVGPDATIAVGGLNLAQLTNIVVQRFLSTGAVDPTFGSGGVVSYEPPAIPAASDQRFQPSDVAFTATGQIIAAGTTTGLQPQLQQGNVIPKVSRATIVQFLAVPGSPGTTPGPTLKSPNDYDGDGRSDIAAEITVLGLFAYRKSTGGDVLQPFGIPTVGETVLAPGDYDGDGKADLAAFLPTLGILAYRPSSGGADVYVRFGPTGVGNAIPVPGDYDGDGRTDVALFLPGSATFVVDPSGGAAPFAVQYGAAGAGQTLPAPGDYDGDGTTDFAVYIPVLGQFFRRLSSNFTSADDGITFGPAGIGASIPAPGRYLGNGATQFALYLPFSGTFAVLTGSASRGNFAVQFGAAGDGQSIPIPGDYDGDGTTDFAVALPTLGSFAYRPSGGGSDRIELFGVAGADQTVPAAAAANPNPTVVRALSLPASESTTPGVAFVPLVDVLEPGQNAKKPARS